MKALNYIKNDCGQETGKEYSTTVWIILKDDRGKAIAWRSVSCKMTSYRVSDEKNSINSLSAFCTQSAVCILYLVCILFTVCSLQFTDRISIAVFVRARLRTEILEFEKNKRNYLGHYGWCVDCMLKSSWGQAQWLSNGYFKPSEDQRKCAAYQ